MNPFFFSLFSLIIIEFYNLWRIFLFNMVYWHQSQPILLKVYLFLINCYFYKWKSDLFEAFKMSNFICSIILFLIKYYWHFLTKWYRDKLFYIICYFTRNFTLFNFLHYLYEIASKSLACIFNRWCFLVHSIPAPFTTLANCIIPAILSRTHWNYPNSRTFTSCIFPMVHCFQLIDGRIIWRVFSLPCDKEN